LSDVADSVGTNLQGAKAVLTGERGVNQVTLLGRVGQDPDVRGTAENPVTVFSLATSFTLKTKAGEYVQKTEWHRISVFRPVLKDLVSQFVKKGDRVYVTGSISYGKIKDQSNNVKQVTSIIADDVMNMTRPMHRSALEEDTRAVSE
jgi:single-strand DNA-binding protein